MESGNIADRVAVTSVTYFRKESEVDLTRSKLALASVREANRLGYHVYLIDGGSYDGFLEQCEQEGADITLVSGASFSQRTRIGLKKGYDSLKDVVMRLEIEKTPLISQIEKMATPIINDEADLVVPHRGDLGSYPPAQRAAERFGDIWFKELTGIEEELDMWGGTRVWKRELTRYFLDETIDEVCMGYQGKPDNWSHYFVPVLRVIKDGWRVKSVPIDFNYPREQASLEEGDFSFTDKRLIQLVSITEALRRDIVRNNACPNQKTSQVTFQ